MDSLGLWVRRIERGVIVVLVGVAAFYVHLHSRDVAVREAAKLAEKGLAPDQLAKFMLQQNQLIELVRNAQGKTEVKTTYVPNEGGITVVAKNQKELLAKYEELLAELKKAKTPEEVKKIEDRLTGVSQEINQPPQVTSTTKGFTSRFGFGIAVSPGHTIRYRVSDGGSLDLPVSPLLDWKFAYWSRYSALAQVNVFYPGLEFTRHVDDFTPKFLHMNNTELGLSGGPGWTGGWGGGVVLRTNW